MARSSLRTALTFIALWWLASSLLADDKEKTSGGLGKPRARAAAEKAVRDTLAQIAKGDPGWKVRMAALVRLVKAGPAAVPVLEKALKKESPGARALATQALAVIRGPAALRTAVIDYDLSKLDSARLGQVAPDFSLTDISGHAYRLSQFRGKNAVVVKFFMDDG
jgi:HEAT repeat protein